jgi:histidine phosphotransferase ChpT
MLEELYMAELLCTRLCHDLTGPIGAVNNGAEFLSEDGFNLQNQAVELIISSATSAVTRLQFYRMTYGVVRDHGEASLDDKKKLAADFFADTKITLDWPDSHADSAGISVSLKMSRLIFNLLIIASGALIRGGTVSVRITQSEAEGKNILITASGINLKWDAEMEKAVSGNLPVNELNPKNVQAYLTKRFCDELNAKLSCTLESDKFVIHVKQPLGNQ